MIDPMPPAEVATAEKYECFGLDADAATVARVREAFTGWMAEHFDLDDVRRSDLVLAVNEALANSAEFAYRLADRPGTIDLHAVYDAESKTLTVCIEDRGTWRERQIEPAPRTRGRGIPLMEALADVAVIEPSNRGTTVRLEWRDVSVR
jgi:serine/threonine-protein kinase RsbW